MKTIKFSHKYMKMPEFYDPSRLLDVIPIKLEDLSTEFLSYDTKYFEHGEFKRYPLPSSGEYMILMLLSIPDKELWTTIRRSTSKKLEYYKNSIGEVFKCEVIE